MGENGTNKKNFYAFIRMSPRPGSECCQPKEHLVAISNLREYEGLHSFELVLSKLK